MTHLSQADLEHLNETELRWMLRDAFNRLATKSSRERDETLTAIDEINKALRHKANTPKP